jgi:hypothetical protein
VREHVGGVRSHVHGHDCTFMSMRSYFCVRRSVFVLMYLCVGVHVRVHARELSSAEVITCVHLFVPTFVNMRTTMT